MAEPPLSLACHSLSVAYDGVQALKDVSLEVRRGEVVALLGPSGSGKTTLLHAAAGFVLPSSGSISIAGSEVSRPGWALPPEKRSIGLVFQSYALWPHLTARETVAYPLRRRGAGRHDALQAAQVWLDKIGLGALAERRPSELSGGEQQRVGLARALAASPALFLLDEPTANLDATLKASLQEEIRCQQQSTDAGAVYVTHDPAEAFAVADRVAVLHGGQLVQVDTSREIYSAPADPWVARLTGACSILPGVPWRAEGDHLRLTMCGSEVICPGRVVNPEASVCVLRPEWLALATPGSLALQGSIRTVRFQGSHTDYVVGTGDGQVLVREPGTPSFEAGQPVSWQPRQAVVVPDN